MTWIGEKSGRKMISQEELLQHLPGPRSFVQLNDRIYILPKDSEVLAALTASGIYDRGGDYKPEVNDCDDFAFKAFGVLKGNGWAAAAMKVIMADTSGHYIIGWLNEDLVWRDLEPQTGKYLSASQIIRRPSIIA